jgi:ribosomal RNA-processing protein 12
LNPAFSQILSQLLYSQPELRPAVLKALKTIVDSNVHIASSEHTPTDGLSPEEAAQNVTFLRSHAESWLAVLFNIFSNVSQDGRGPVGEVITAWATIAGEHVCDTNIGDSAHINLSSSIGNSESVQQSC